MVGKAGATDPAQVIEAANQPLLDFIVIGDVFEGFQLTALGPLPIGDMQEGQPVLLTSKGCTDAAVHAAAHKDHGKLPSFGTGSNTRLNHDWGEAS